MCECGTVGGRLRYVRVRGGAAEDLYKLQERASGFLCGRNYNKMYQRRRVLREYEMHVTFKKQEF